MSIVMRRQPKWMRDLRAGDVIKRKRVLRVVRKVSRYHNGDLRSVTCAIRARSWTNRPYKILGYNDLIQLGYSFSHRPARVRLQAIELVLQGDIEDHHRRHLYAYDVVGVIS